VKSKHKVNLQSSRKGASKQPLQNPFGHYRRSRGIEEFRECFERRGGVSMLKGFLNGTASWVQENFSAIELEVHQAATFGRVARDQGQKPNPKAVRSQCPRLAILATDAEMREILGGNPRPKEITAGMLARVLHREPSSIKRWAQGTG
jgi:hypothetical protein